MKLMRWPASLAALLTIGCSWITAVSPGVATAGELGAYEAYAYTRAGCPDDPCRVSDRIEFEVR